MNKQDKINRILTDMDNLGKAYEMAEALERVDNDNDLYLLAKAIAPESIASGWTVNFKRSATFKKGMLYTFAASSVSTTTASALVPLQPPVCSGTFTAYGF